MGTGVRKRILRRNIGHLPHANPRESRPASAVVRPWRPWGLAVKAKREDCYNATNAPR
jgi:hypothetical protein